MTKKTFAGDDDSTCTTEATLAALATSVTEFVATGTLDSRLAGKLEKRFAKEAEKIHQSGASTKPGHKALEKALAALAEALCQHDASLLVRANAALRAQDGLAAKNGVN